MIDYDVVVVGAGPAGSTTAKILSEEGINTLLIDKEKFPREKPCGGALPICVLKRFPYISKTKSIESNSYGWILHSGLSKYKIKVQKDNPAIAMVLRKKFDQELVNIAIKKGVEFKDRVKVNDVNYKNKYAELSLNNNNSIKTSLVIGADGYNSIIAHKTGLYTKRNFAGLSVVEEFQVNEDVLDKYFTEKKLCHVHIRIFELNGYGWVFPKKNNLNIGLGESRIKDINDKKNLKFLFNKYIEFLKKQHIIPKRIHSEKLTGGVEPVWPHDKTYKNRVILCGDAAGFINPISGEGIHYALVSAEIAAQVGIKAIVSNNTKEKLLSQYQKKWKKDFGKNIEYMLYSTKKIRHNDEKFFKFMSQDKKLAKMIFNIMIGQESIYKLRWKLMRRYLYNSIKTKFDNFSE